MNDTPLVDWSQLDAIADGWNGEFQEIYTEFLSEIPQDFDALAAAVDAGLVEDVAKIAHRIKGCVANFGFERVRSAAFAIEQQGRGGDLSEATSTLQAARGFFQEAVQEVDARNRPRHESIVNR